VTPWTLPAQITTAFSSYISGQASTLPSARCSDRILISGPPKTLNASSAFLSPEEQK
jgi:hypothetical protein